MSDLDTFLGTADSGLTPIVADAEKRNGIPPGLLSAVLFKGEKSAPDAVSPKGAIGVGQLMPDTAKAMGVKVPTDPAQNIEGSAKYLKAQLDAHGGDPRLAVAAYNAGPGAVQKYGGVPPFKETQAYVDRVVPPSNDLEDFLAGAGGQKSSAAQALLSNVGDTQATAQSPATQKILDAVDKIEAVAEPPSARVPGNQLAKPAKGDGLVVNAKTRQPLNDAQRAAYEALAANHQLDLKAAPGSMGLPLAQINPGDIPDGSGVYYMDTDGKLQQTPTSGVEAGGLTSLANGALLGFGHDLTAGIQALKATHGNPFDPMFGNFFHQAKTIYDQAEQGYSTVHPVEHGLAQGAGTLATVAPSMMMGGEAAAPVLGRMGGLGRFVAGEAGGPGIGGKALQLLSRGTAGAGQGAVASLLTAHESDKPLSVQLGEGAAGGGVVGAALPEAISAGKGLANALTGNYSDVSPEVAALARTAVDKYGIPLRVSQIRGVGNRELAFADSERIGQGGTGYAENNAQQKGAFTKAVANTFGEDSDKLTPDVMNRAKKRIGGDFNDVAANTTISDTTPLTARLDKVGKDASSVLPDNEVAPILKQIDNVKSAIKDGSLSGQSYQALVQKGSALDVAQNSSNASIRHYAGEIRDALDDALEAHATPEDLSKLQNARWQYKNLMTIKDLAAKAGVTGEISPLLLNGAVNRSFKNRAFAGAGDLGELAQIGQTFMKEPPNSGTPGRLKSMLMGAGLAAGGADAGLAIHDPILALKMAAAAAAAGAAKYGSNVVTGAVNLSPPIRSRLLSRALDAAMPTMGASYASVLNDNAPAVGGVLASRLLPEPNKSKVGQ